MNEIRGSYLWGLVWLGVVETGCGSAEKLKDVCIPTLDCAAIDTIEAPANCTACADCRDNWGACMPGGSACKRGSLDLNPDAAGCESPASAAKGQWVMHSTGEAVSLFKFNGGQMQVQMSVSALAYDEDEPTCIPTFSKSCAYTVHALQLEISDFAIPESTWSNGVATLNGPVAASDDASGAGVLAPMLFAFEVQQDSERRVALSSAPVSVRVTRETDPQRASYAVEANAIDFGGYEITDLSMNGELVSN
ncbi:MAG: hypothetical protein ABI488_11575 [Polyangiaceae bacterium]